MVFHASWAYHFLPWWFRLEWCHCVWFWYVCRVRDRKGSLVCTVHKCISYPLYLFWFFWLFLLWLRFSFRFWFNFWPYSCRSYPFFCETMLDGSFSHCSAGIWKWNLLRKSQISSRIRNRCLPFICSFGS